MLCLRYHRNGVNKMPLLSISQNPSIRLAPILLLGGMALLVGATASAQEPVPTVEEPVPTAVEDPVLTVEEPVPSAVEEPSLVAIMERATFELSGRLNLSYRYRTKRNRGTTDSDGYASLYLDGAGTDVAGKENFRFHVDGYASMDFNGPEDPNESFYGLADTRSRFRPFLYSAWAESTALVDGAKVRIGRQEVHREDALYFDGARIDFGDGAWRALAYAGSPVKFYEANRSGDQLAGVGIRWWKARTLRLGLDQIYLRDEAPPADETSVARNHLTILSGRWLQSQNLTLDGSTSWISGRSRRANVRAFMQRPELKLWSRVEIRRQNDYGEVVATELSPFAATLGDVAPYWSASVQVGKGFEHDVDLGFGFHGRWLEAGGTEGLYNREYDQWFGSLTVREAFGGDWRVGVRADYWDSSGPNAFTGGAFAKYQQQPGQTLELGTDYSKYRYDSFTGREYLDDRQVYVRAAYPIREDTSLRLRLARDGSQIGVDYLVEVSLGWEF